jgi:predicted lysophospholipase L1 biosynthesis ABC-type transport system permease subunit
VGVVSDTRDVALGGESPLAMYVPYAQHPGSYALLLLRGRGGTAVSEATVRRIVAAVDPGATVLGSRTLDDRLRAELRPQRTASAWIAVFGGIALLLACIGLYGVIAQGVLQRTRELAVRSALGATPQRILATVLADGMRLAAIGGILGAIGVVVALKVVRSMFAGVRFVDLVPASGALGLLAVAVLVATWLPARRAARLNAVDALRSDRRD